MANIVDFPNDPRFTIKNVAAQTGIRPVTLRAWERRYQLLDPHRGDNRYRLYSERDVAILRWVKDRVDHDVPISSAVEELRTLIKTGDLPEALPAGPAVRTSQPDLPPDEYTKKLYKALIAHNEGEAADILRQAQSIFDLHTILLRVISPALVQIGWDWYNGKIRITTEHFASTLIRGKLLTMLQSYPSRRGFGHILMGCAPDEQHEISSLMFAVMLRASGYRVEYLGPDIPVDDLVDYASEEHPDLVILTASMEETALNLKKVQEKLLRLKPAVLFAYAGQAFIDNQRLRAQIPGNYLGDSMEQALEDLRALLSAKKTQRQ